MIPRRYTGGNKPRGYSGVKPQAFAGSPIAERGSLIHARHGSRVIGGVAGYAPVSLDLVNALYFSDNTLVYFSTGDIVYDHA